MSNRLAGGIKAGQTDVTLPVELRLAADSTEATGKVYGDVTGSYWRQGGVRVAISTATLGSVNAAHSDGGFIEVDGTNQPGIYRFDVPDAAFATGADWVVVTLKAAGCFVQSFMFALETKGAADLNDLSAADTRTAIGLATANLDTQLSTLSTLSTGDIPTAVQNADALLKRDLDGMTGEASRSVLNAVRFLRNGFTISGSTLTVLKEDDTTAAYTRTLATDEAAIPIVGIS